MGRRRTAFVAGVLAWLLPLVSASASAHELGTSRFDAPVPLPLLFAGAGATVSLTALLLAVSPGSRDREANPANPAGTRGTADTIEGAGASETAGPSGPKEPSEPTAATGHGRAASRTPERGRERPRAVRVIGRLPPTVARPTRLLARSIFLALFVGAVVLGLFGTQATGSLTTTFVWPLWIKGVGLYAILFGSPWRTLSPWRAVYDALCRLEGTDLSLRESSPRGMGHWPALLGFCVLVGVLENLTIVPRSSRLTAAVLAGYGAFVLGGGVIFGRRWLERADAFAVFYGLLGRVAPIRPVRTESGGYRIVLRTPWQGCTQPVADFGLLAFAVAAVYTVSFDGFTATPEFQRLLFDTRDALGAGGGVSVVLYLLGFVGFVGCFLAVSWTMGAIAGSSGRPRAIALAFAPTVLPIAAAYEIAHNYPFVLRNLGAFVAEIGAVLGATAGEPIALLGWLSVGVFWGSQVLLIVLGHVIAVVAAHRVALAHSETAGQARRMHAPLVLLMVGYTVLSLWIVSRPIATG